MTAFTARTEPKLTQRAWWASPFVTDLNVKRKTRIKSQCELCKRQVFEWQYCVCFNTRKGAPKDYREITQSEMALRTMFGAKHVGGAIT